jgi:hypothetical protein
MLRVRPAQEQDVGQIRDIFIAVYQNDYPYQGVYDELWLKRSVLSDDALVLVAEDTDTGQVVGTASVLFDIGAHSDLVGEFGRLAVHPDFRRLHVATLLMDARIEAIKTACTWGSWWPARFTRMPSASAWPTNSCRRVSPARTSFTTASFALLARFFGDALALRRNNPRVIPEVYPLAQVVMHHARLRSDLIVDEESPPYPQGPEFTVEEMRTEGYSTVLRIERGRVRHRELFGPVRLEYGFFRLRATHTTYLVAREGSHVAGAVGFMLDPIEHTVRVIELIAASDDVIRFLLAELERRCREDHAAEYMEIDVSAYPAHATDPAGTGLHAGGLSPGHGVSRSRAPGQSSEWSDCPDSRISALRSRNRSSRWRICDARLHEPGRGSRMARAIAEVPLFAGMSAEQALRLAGVCRVEEFEPGARIFSASDPTDCVYLVLDGEAQVSAGSPSVPIATIRRGETLGEISLLTQTPRAATATAATRVEAAAIPHRDLHELIRRRPDIGVIIYRNLALGLGHKLRQTDASFIARPAKSNAP